MELGSLIQGYPKENYEIEVNSSWGILINALIEAIGPAYTENGRFENEAFMLRSFVYDEECNCGFDDALLSVEAQFPHSDDCFITKFLKLGNCFNPNGNWSKAAKSLFIEHGFDPKSGLAPVDYCTCVANNQKLDTLQTFGLAEGHKDSCPIVQPNFWYKVSNYKLIWYKYPLRSALANVDINLVNFFCIIAECIKSVMPK